MPRKKPPESEQREVAPVAPPDDPRLVALTASHLEIQGTSGPLPDPEMLARYNQVVPGSAERIMAWVEEETRHRHALEKQFADAEVKDLRSHRRIEHLGQLFALVVTLSAVGCGTYAVIHGYPTAGTVLSGATILSLV